LTETSRFREHLLSCLGGNWPDPCPLDPRLEDSIARKGYRIEKVSYQVELGERVPAYVLIPDSATVNSPAPGVAVWHQHAGRFDLGKSEPAGLIGNPMHFTGTALAQEGYVVLCPDAICFEERKDTVLHGSDFERFTFLRYLVGGKCLAWKNILDMRRAIDYFTSRPDVNANAIGCYGHSLGSVFTWLVGPWEPRLKCLAGNCCLPTYSATHRIRCLHSYSTFIPGLHQYGDTPDVAALIAPRPLHLNFGAEDTSSPIPEVREGMEVIARAYASRDASDNFSFFIEEDSGHVLSDQMWERTRSKFLDNLPPK
jgi:dienelactone hydrolase